MEKPHLDSEGRSGAGLVKRGGEEDAPEVGRRRKEFDDDEGTFVSDLRRTKNFGFDLDPDLGVLEDDLGSIRNRIGKDQHGAGGADRVSNAIEGGRLPDDVHEDTNPEQGTLSAAPLFGGRRARRNDFGRGRRPGAGQGPMSG